MSELKNCPFCGYEPETKEVHIYPNGEKSPAYIKCKRCNYHLFGYNEEGLLVHWNIRPVEDALRSELERVESCFLEFETITDKGLYARVSDVVKALSDARSELDQLQEQVRWRKYPDEKPEKNGKYYLCGFFSTGDADVMVGRFANGLWYDEGLLELNQKFIVYWRSIDVPHPPEEA